MTRPCVLDASVALNWVLPGEAEPDWPGAFNTPALHIPALWWFEVRNAMLIHERRGHVHPDQTSAFLARLERLPLATDRAPDSSRLLTLGRAHKLTAYDAAYLELALRLALPLATLDSALARAAAAEGVELVARR